MNPVGTPYQFDLQVQTKWNQFKTKFFTAHKLPPFITRLAKRPPPQIISDLYSRQKGNTSQDYGSRKVVTVVSKRANLSRAHWTWFFHLMPSKANGELNWLWNAQRTTPIDCPTQHNNSGCCVQLPSCEIRWSTENANNAISWHLSLTMTKTDDKSQNYEYYFGCRLLSRWWYTTENVLKDEPRCSRLLLPSSCYYQQKIDCPEIASEENLESPLEL